LNINALAPDAFRQSDRSIPLYQEIRKYRRKTSDMLAESVRKSENNIEKADRMAYMHRKSI
jgi:hypothetical protein